MYRKCLLLLLAAVIVFTAGCSTEQNSATSLEQTAEKDSARDEEQAAVGTNDTAKIELILDTNAPHWNEVKPIAITDNKMINDIMSMIEQSKPLTDEAKISSMSGMAKKNNKLIVTAADGTKEEINFAYDTLYEIGYIEKEGQKLEPDYSFFRYAADLNEYTNPDTNIEQQVMQLFDKYNWTVDYRINTLQQKLPDNLQHKAGEYPVKIYWAYNNELSKQIGLDFTAYIGKDAAVEIYRLREPLPEFMHPRKDARGIVLKNNDNDIIGAYIDAGRHSSFACSLDRKSLKEITGREWDDWIEGYIDYSDELEIKLSQMEPQDIIREYFNALDKQEIKTVWACMTRKNLAQHLSTNLNNQYLFNSEYKTDYNIKSAELLEIKEMKGFDNEPGMLEYMVEVDFDFKKPITADDGVWPRFVVLKKETEKSGWRIDGIGTGP